MPTPPLPNSGTTGRWLAPPSEVLPQGMRMGQLVTRVPTWYNDPACEAVGSSGTQLDATCGLFAVNHLAAVSARLRRAASRPALTQRRFEDRGLEARVGDDAANLRQPGGAANYDFAVLHANLGPCGLACFPMTPADLEGTAGKMSVVAGGRFENLFGDHIIAEGSYRVAGYLLRIPQHGGHWIALVPAESAEDRAASRALLCDSMLPAPLLLRPDEAAQLLTAAAFDAAGARHFNGNAFNAQWGCFLVGMD